MDPLSAIGLVGNIITFLEFGYEISSAAKKIHNSLSGATRNNDDLESMNRQFMSVASGLKAGIRPGDTSKETKELQTLLAECDTITADIQALLGTLRVSGPRSKRQSLKLAIRDWRKREEKTELEKRLDRCKQQVSLHISCLTRSEVVDRLNKLIADGHASDTELQSLGKDVQQLRVGTTVSCLSAEALEQVRSIVHLSDKAMLAAYQSRMLEELRFDHVNVRFYDIEDPHEETFQWIYDDGSEGSRSSTVSTPIRSTESLGIHVTIGRHLEYTTPKQLRRRDIEQKYMSHRSLLFSKGFLVEGEPHEDAISRFSWEPPVKTSNFIIDDDIASENSFFAALRQPDVKRVVETHQQESWDSRTQLRPDSLTDVMTQARETFTTWLSQDCGIFHISGKAGSGKSTLMKAIWKHPSTRKHLTYWADGKELVMAKFFFWKPGTDLQRTIKGLIRGLLYSFLSSCPGLIPVAFPKHWDMINHGRGVHLDNEDYSKAFNRLISDHSISSRHRFALFIDGLDEFEGNHADLIRILRKWINHNKDVKLCVSSRDWAIFTDSFGGCPSLRLHELTSADIKVFVRNKLSDMNPGDLTGTEREHSKTFDILESLICERADGIFLWVKLIVYQIKEGLSNGDQLKDLTNIIRSLPTELELMFEQLLGMIPARNRKLAVTLMSVASACSVMPLYEYSLLHASFIEEYVCDKCSESMTASKQIEFQETTDRVKRARKRVYGVCKGLLELRPPFRNHLQPDLQSSEMKQLFGDQVSLTHRSILEFIQGDVFRQFAQKIAPGLDVNHALCQTYLSLIRLIKLPKQYFTPRYDSINRMLSSMLFGSDWERKAPFLMGIWIPSGPSLIRNLVEISILCYDTIQPAEEPIDLLTLFRKLAIDKLNF
ncbi:hypothetical protein F5Y16DRAFT_398627 [Xylariaceae sp. FL0255]|nr:hypothetical protein F5Y16DRAFT_398627 [Xylariaceae sp. FL0255]